MTGDNGDITRHYHGGNPESVAAFESTNRITRQKQRDRVWLHLLNQGMTGGTCDETEIALDMPHQACSARITELKRDRQVVKIGTRPTRTGRMAAVYVVSLLSQPGGEA